MNTKTESPDMTPITKKLFVIIDPTVKRQIAFEKALLVASMGNCAIHAFACTYAELSEHGEFSSRKDMKLYMLDKAEQQLDELVKRSSDNDVPFSSEVVWNQNWYEMAAQAVARSGSDLVIKSSFYHDKVKRFLYKTSDFYLMRYCSSPVLFTHQPQQWQSSHMLACVDLESSDTEHKRLNNSIIKNAKILADTLGMKLYIAATYDKGFNQSVLQLVEESSVGTRECLAEIFGVDVEHLLLRQGATVETLHNISEEIEASIMVIGSLARTGISGKIIGNTAEKLLDTVNADIVTIC
jgi:universal stress protein E